MNSRSFASFGRALGVVVVTCTIAPATTFGCAPRQAQSGSSQSNLPDITGLWDGAPDGQSTQNLNLYMKSVGSEIPFTPFAAKRYNDVDLAKNPNGFCLPPGPTRALTGASPFFIVTNPQVVTILFENHYVYRAIYLDGRPHPEEMKEYPFFMGHSIGTWEGNTLVVDTVGIDDRTWLDSSGVEHSNQLHITERFEVLGADLIKYSATFDDPVFFTKSWTATVNLARQKDTRLLEYVCIENEKDSANLVPTRRDDTQ